MWEQKLYLEVKVIHIYIFFNLKNWVFLILGFGIGLGGGEIAYDFGEEVAAGEAFGGEEGRCSES